VEFAYYKQEPVWLAVSLVNTANPLTGADQIPDVAALSAFLAKHGVGADSEVRDADLAVIRTLRQGLRAVFAAGDDESAATAANQLLRRYNAVPRIVKDAELGLHLHFEEARRGIAHWVGAITAMGVAFVLCEYGADRLGVCAAAGCDNVFIDTSKNRSRRYCSTACAHRVSTRAYRTRQASRYAPKASRSTRLRSSDTGRGGKE
jgi:predicted RNA-binding Zn ribbon-like protein